MTMTGGEGVSHTGEDRGEVQPGGVNEMVMQEDNNSDEDESFQ